MKESYEKGLANRSAPNPTLAMVTSRVWHGQGVHTGQPLSSEITIFVCRPRPVRGKAISSMPLIGEASADAAESENLCMRRHPKRENREILLVSAEQDGTSICWRNGQRTSQAVMLA